MIAPFPELMALAHVEAHDLQDGLVACSTFSGEPVPSVRALTTVCAARLCDLTRPASRDAVVRLVAAKVGLDVGATAPDFRYESAISGSSEWIRPAGWSLFSGPMDNWYFWYGEPEEWDDGGRRKDWTWLPGTAVSRADPAEALAAIVNALWPPTIHTEGS